MEKYSEDLNRMLNSYQDRGDIDEHIVDNLHLELVGFFKKYFEYILENSPGAAAHLAPPPPTAH